MTRQPDSAYDRMTAETRESDPGCATYALISDHHGPCSIVADYDSLDAAIEAARTMGTDSAPTELSDLLDYDDSDDRDDSGLISEALMGDWSVVASAPAGEYWSVMVEGLR